jgi:hypothetical protein
VERTIAKELRKFLNRRLQGDKKVEIDVPMAGGPDEHNTTQHTRSSRPIDAKVSLPYLRAAFVFERREQSSRKRGGK